MKRDFKHPQIFADLMSLTKQYYPIHNNLPKPFRYSIGELILKEIAECLRNVVLANAVQKQTIDGRKEGARYVRELRSRIAVLQGFIMLGWSLKLISHGAMSELGDKLETISKQAARWQQWFEQMVV